MARDAQTIQTEIERTREALATTVDQIATKASPKNVAAQTKDSLLEKARTPVGKAVIGGSAALVAGLIAWRVWASRR